MSKNRFYQKRVVITGGSSGIGLATAHRFAQLGARLFLIARDIKKLDKAYQELVATYPEVVVETHSADVGERAEIEAVLEEIGAREGIDVLINNAGVMYCGRMSDISSADHERAIQVNYLGMLYAAKAAWPYLAESGDGQIAFVSSVAGYLGLIGYSAYAPAKFAIAGLAECLRMEGKAVGISVSLIYPPDTETPLLAHERANALPETRALTAKAAVLSPDVVAKALVDGLQKRKFELFCNIESKWIRRFKNLLPKLYFSVLDRSAKG